MHVDLLDVDGNSATVSKSTPDPGSTKLLLACYRLQDPTSRLQMKVRTTEGEFGDIKATVVAESNPKSAVVVTFPVKPLSLHCRALTLTEEVSKRRVCEMVTDEMATSTTKLTHSILFDSLHSFCSCFITNVPRFASLRSAQHCE